MENKIKQLILEGKTDNEIIELILSEKEDDNFEKFYKEYGDKIYDIFYGLVPELYEKYNPNEDLADRINSEYYIEVRIKNENDEDEFYDSHAVNYRHSRYVGIQDPLYPNLILPLNYINDLYNKFDRDEILEKAGIQVDIKYFKDWIKKEVYPEFKNEDMENPQKRKEIITKLENLLVKKYKKKIEDAAEDWYWGEYLDSIVEDFINENKSEYIEFYKK